MSNIISRLQAAVTAEVPPWALLSLAVIGAATLSYRTYEVFSIISQFFRPSSLPRYLHCDEGSWALVTGASNGIGKAFAEELLERGFNVVLHGRNEAKLTGIKNEFEAAHKTRKIQILVADATDVHGDFAAIRQQMEALPGKLTILVNNVGGIHSRRQYQTLDQYTTEELINNINANATFTTLITSTLLPLLKKNGPSLILNCGSIVNTIAPAYIATYVGGKGYIHAWAASLKMEIQAQGYADKVEVLTVAIGNTISGGNRTQESGTTLTSQQCAKACLDRVGCGLDEIVPHPKYLLSILPFYILPRKTMKTAMIPVLKRRYDAEQAADAEDVGKS